MKTDATIALDLAYVCFRISEMVKEPSLAQLDSDAMPFLYIERYALLCYAFAVRIWFMAQFDCILTTQNLIKTANVLAKNYEVYLSL